MAPFRLTFASLLLALGVVGAAGTGRPDDTIPLVGTFQRPWPPPVAAHASASDDWPQFRHDAARTAASTSPLKLPLVEVWMQESHLHSGHTPLFTSVVWHNRAYCTACEENRRYLVCMDARTGALLWRQPLSATQLQFPISDVAGPAVSESGIVFVYDWIGSVQSQAKRDVGPKGQVLAMSSFCVRAFDARTGGPADGFPLVAMGANGVLPRLHVTHGDVDQVVMPVPPSCTGSPP
jgi:hypothetical protein